MRVVIAGGRWLRRRALEQRLVLVPGIEVAYSVPGLLAGLSLCRRSAADALIIDDELLDDVAVTRLTKWRSRHNVRVIAVVPRPVILPTLLLDSPIDALISFACEPKELARALCGRNARRALPPGLSPQEQAVTRHTIEGMSLKQMAAILGCGAQSVHTYRQRAMTKLGVSSIAELAMRFGRLLATDRVGG